MSTTMTAPDDLSGQQILIGPHGLGPAPVPPATAKVTISARGFTPASPPKATYEQDAESVRRMEKQWEEALPPDVLEEMRQVEEAWRGFTIDQLWEKHSGGTTSERAVAQVMLARRGCKF